MLLLDKPLYWLHYFSESIIYYHSSMRSFKSIQYHLR